MLLLHRILGVPGGTAQALDAQQHLNLGDPPLVVEVECQHLLLTRVEGRAEHLAREPEQRGHLPWNEPNYDFQPVMNKMRLAGQYFAKLRSLCKASSRKCGVAAGDFADGPTLSQNDLDEYYRGMGSKPPVKWAYHVYQAIYFGRHSSSSQFARFLRWGPVQRASGGVWITEAGAYKIRGADTQSEDEQAEDLRRFFALTAYSRNLSTIKRFYYYPWKGPQQPKPTALVPNPKPVNDTSLIGPDGATRKVYCAFRAKWSSPAFVGT